VAVSCKHGRVSSGSIQGGEFLYYLSDCALLKNNPALWSRLFECDICSLLNVIVRLVYECVLFKFVLTPTKSVCSLKIYGTCICTDLRWFVTYVPVVINGYSLLLLSKFASSTLQINFYNKYLNLCFISTDTLQILPLNFSKQITSKRFILIVPLVYQLCKEIT